MIPTRSREKSSLTGPLKLIAAILTIAALYFGRDVLIPLALALVLSFILTPFVKWLEALRFGRAIASVIVLAGALGIAAYTGWVVAGQMLDVTAQIGSYKANIQAKINSLHSAKTGNLGKATQTLTELRSELSPKSSAAPSAAARRGARQQPQQPIPVQVTQPPTDTLQYLRNLLGPLLGPIRTVALAVVFTLFVLIKRADIRSRMLRLAGLDQLSITTQALDEGARRLSRYLRLQFLVNPGYGCLFGICLYLIGIPHPLLWGVMAALLRFVPYLGTLTAAAMPTVLAFAVFPGWSHAVLAFSAFLVLDLTTANFVEPVLYGAHTGISALAILVAAIFWTMLWGPLGLLLSTPLTVCLMVIGRYVPQLNFLDVLLGDDPMLPPEANFYQRLLAFDDEEARTIARDMVTGERPANERLLTICDAILLPALSLAERDKSDELLDEERIEFVRDRTQEIIDEFWEEMRGASAPGPDEGSAGIGTAMRIVCVPLRGQSDRIAATMLERVLRLSGFEACTLPPQPLSATLTDLAQRRPAIICVSALPPSALGPARRMIRFIRERVPDAWVLLGLWRFEDLSDVLQKIDGHFAHRVVVSLAGAVDEIAQFSEQRRVEGPGFAAMEGQRTGT